MLTRGAIGNLINRYRAVLNKCSFLNAFGTLTIYGATMVAGVHVGCYGGDAYATNASSISALFNTPTVSGNTITINKKAQYSYNVATQNDFMGAVKSTFSLSTNSNTEFVFIGNKSGNVSQNEFFWNSSTTIYWK